MIDIIYCQNSRTDLKFHKIINIKQFNVVEGISEERNRKAVEHKQVDILLAPERVGKKDRLNQRDSGLNHVLCALAHENNVAIGFSFSDVVNSKYRAILIGRMMQNVRLCRKYKVRMVLASFAKDPADMRPANEVLAFGQMLGMTPKEATIALNFTKKRQAIKMIREKKEKISFN